MLCYATQCYATLGGVAVQSGAGEARPAAGGRPWPASDLCSTAAPTIDRCAQRAESPRRDRGTHRRGSAFYELAGRAGAAMGML